ncbi:transposase [Maribacter stanieri]|uniref:transposase n=1 Tax=Maribacter stanieri TaxID=440514 RepID=UPI003CD0CA82
MKRSKYSASQIRFAIEKVETGTRIQEVCRKMRISETIFFTIVRKNIEGSVFLNFVG